MVPSAVVLLDRLPLTHHGKVDRNALPPPDSDAVRTSEQSAGALPQTPHEEIVAGVWAEVIGIAVVRREDNFFDLGGHSLLATRVMARIRDLFRIEIPLRTLFEQPTVATFAAGVQQALEQQSRLTPETPLKARERGGDLPLSYAQQRLWFLHQWEPSNPFYNSPAALRLSGRLDIAALRRTLAEVVRRHEVLRTCFPSLDGAPSQQI